jgi:hypothetical protein
MHDCVDVDVYLCVGSRPVVERCRGVRVAPAPPLSSLVHANGDEAEAATSNLWNQVDDFDWLRAEQSPHWSEIPPEQRVTNERWGDLIPRGPGAGWEEQGQVVYGNEGGRFKTDVEQLLKLVGVKIPRM